MMVICLPYGKGIEDVRNLVVQILGRRTFQAEEGTRSNAQKQRHFLECLKRWGRIVVWSRLSEEVAAGDEVRDGSEALGLMQILEGITGCCEDSVVTLGILGSHCKVLSAEVISFGLFRLWIHFESRVNRKF